MTKPRNGALVATMLLCVIMTANAFIIAIYKPPLMLCSLHDDGPRAVQKHRPRRSTLADLDLPGGLHMVGRLDRDSEGLLLLTDNGTFTQEVHSSAEKVYWALVKGVPTEEALDKMRQGGLWIRGAKTLPPERVQALGESELSRVQLPPAVPGMDRVAGNSWIEIILCEGRNRQVRRITKDAGHETLRLVRIAIGSLNLKNLNPALKNDEYAWQVIDQDEVLGNVK